MQIQIAFYEDNLFTGNINPVQADAIIYCEQFLPYWLPLWITGVRMLRWMNVCDAAYSWLSNCRNVVHRIVRQHRATWNTIIIKIGVQWFMHWMCCIRNRLFCHWQQTTPCANVHVDVWWTVPLTLNKSLLLLYLSHNNVIISEWFADDSDLIFRLSVSLLEVNWTILKHYVVESLL